MTWLGAEKCPELRVDGRYALQETLVLLRQDVVDVVVDVGVYVRKIVIVNVEQRVQRALTYFDYVIAYRTRHASAVDVRANGSWHLFAGPGTWHGPASPGTVVSVVAVLVG